MPAELASEDELVLPGCGVEAPEVWPYEAAQMHFGAVRWPLACAGVPAVLLAAAGIWQLLGHILYIVFISS
jgi:hypothetical protein